MKRSKRREIPLLVTLLVLTLVSSCWAWSRYHSARRALAHAAADLADCYAAAQRIETLRDLPDIAATLDRQDRQLPALVEAASKQAGFDARNAVDAIHADRPRRVGDTPFKEAATHLSLRRVTLSQFVAFLLSLRDQDPALGVRNLRITAPRGEETGDFWSAEATLTYLIYAPPQDRPS